jgi:Luciferase
MVVPEKEKPMSTEQGKIPATRPAGRATPLPGKQDGVLPLTPAAAKEAAIREVSSWEGVTVHQHRFGGAEFRVGRRELGHLHASFADLPFPRRVRDKPIADGRAHPHHVLPDSGWVTVLMRTDAELAAVVELFRQNYERAMDVRR